MAKSYNQIGSLRELLDILKEEGINDFQTLDEIRKFRDNFDNLLDDIRIKNKELLDNNIVKLESEQKNISEVIDKKLKFLR